MEAVFPSEKFQTFFRQSLVLPDRNWSEVNRKMAQKFPTGILFPRSIDFRYFPEGTGDFSCFFLQVSAVSGGLNDRPEAPVSGNAEFWAGSRIREGGTRSSERVLVSGSARP